MRTKLKTAAIAAALCMSVSSAALAESCRIGVILPLTGSSADYGADFRAGAELGLEEVNASGGVGGKPLELLYGDSKGQAREGVAEFQRLVQVENVPAIISTVTGVVLPQFPISKRTNTPMMAVGAVSPEIRQGGPTVFSNFPLADDEETEIAEYAYNTLGHRKAAIIFENTAYGQGMSEVFMEAFRELGGEFVAEEIVEKGGRDFRSQLTRIAAEDPPLIVTYAYYAEAGLIVRQAAELGVDAQFISHGAVQNSAFVEIAGGAATGFISGAPSWDEESPRVQEFIERYEAIHNKKPDLYGPYFYDAVRIMAAAAEKEGCTREGILKGLTETKDFPGVNGSMTFGEDGIVELPLTFVQFDGTSWKKID